ncbi:hypothetical protein MKEN_00847500 [Mycena kentingensis (nom. inval.)]|nr:hypothetical protein MKEN_00847500 [Mycena kentingensis (nom. inval.)]
MAPASTKAQARAGAFEKVQWADYSGDATELDGALLLCSGSSKGKGKAKAKEKPKAVEVVSDSDVEIVEVQRPTTMAIASAGTSKQAGVLGRLPDRAKLEAERITRQKRTLEDPEDDRQAKRLRTKLDIASLQSTPSGRGLRTPRPDSTIAARRFEDGIVLPTFTVYANPRADGREMVDLPDIFGVGDEPDKTLELVVVSSFGGSSLWLGTHFPEDVPVILIGSIPEARQGDGSTRATTMRASSNPNWVATCPAMRKGGCLHPKVMVLSYKSGRLRVVVSTANLEPIDWSVLENAVFIQDVYLKSSSKSRSSLTRNDGATPNSKGHSTAFKTEDSFVSVLEEFLKALEVGPALELVQETHPGVRLKEISSLSKLWEWRGVRAELVSSIAGKYEGWKRIRKTGHPRLMCAVEALGLTVNNLNSKKTPPLSLECQGSSVAFYTPQWMNQFYISASGNRQALREHMAIPESRRKKEEYPTAVKVLFPSQRQVLEIGEAAKGAGSMFCDRAKWESKNCPRTLFHVPQSSAGPTLMHTKANGNRVVFGEAEEETAEQRGGMDVPRVAQHDLRCLGQFEWVGCFAGVECPSSLLRLAAVLTLRAVQVNNFELGVVLPLQTTEELERMSAWDRPAKQYAGNDIPWLLDENGEFWSELTGRRL